MATEQTWVTQSLIPKLEATMPAYASDGKMVKVAAGQKLCYAHEIARYSPDGSAESQVRCYQTDILISEHSSVGWVPRIIIECKLGKVTTHDALTYSTKAATHKQVYPYVRYGILIASWGQTPLPPRLVRHGAFFDFMLVWQDDDPTGQEWENLRRIIASEMEGSRQLQDILLAKSKVSWTVLHRPLKFNI